MMKFRLVMKKAGRQPEYSEETFTKQEAEAEAVLRNQTQWPWDANGNPIAKTHYSIISLKEPEADQ
jgi:YD repeat-containing protein